jgi:hypothetical protein
MRRGLGLLAAIALIGLAACPPAAAALGPGGQAGPALPLGSTPGLGGNIVSSETGAANPIDALTAETGPAESLLLGVFASGVLSGASSALHEAAHVISQTTAPRLQSTWFSATYWRVAGLAGLLSLPFLFAAAAQALLRADPMLLARSVFGYLPLAVIAVNLAAPITMLLLSATDEMSSVIAGAGMGGGVHFLQQTAELTTGLAALDGSPFLAIAVGLLTLAAAVALAVEMLIREAAVYVVVLMLPLAFAALIWPARRAWAVRLIELLVALILSKFVIVAVLSLAGAAYGGSGSPTGTRLLTAMTLVLLSTFAPWVMLRLLPFTELAAGAAGGIRNEASRLGNIPIREARRTADTVAGWAESLPHLLRRQAGQPDGGESSSGGDAGPGGAASVARERLAGDPEPAAPMSAEDESGEVVDRDGPAAASGGPGIDIRPGAAGSSETTSRRSTGPFSQMDPEWQFESFEREIALDAEAVRGFRGADPLHGLLPQPAEPRDPQSRDVKRDEP